NPLRVRQKLVETHYRNGKLMCASNGRTARRVAVSGPVHTLHQITCLLKFDGKKERRRNIIPSDVDARLVGATGSDLAGPETATGLVRITAEEVIVMLLRKEPRLIDRIRPVDRVAVVDGQRCRTLRRQCAAGRVAERQICGPGPLDIRVVNYEHRKSLA